MSAQRIATPHSACREPTLLCTRDHVDDDDKLTERFVLSGQVRVHSGTDPIVHTGLGGREKEGGIRLPWLSGPSSLWYLLPLKRLK